jgi:flagellar motor switch protein FliM
VPPGGPATGRPVAAYDFRRPTKLSRDHVRALQMVYETFARRLTIVLTGGLRQVCQVSIADIAQQSYDEYVNGLPTQTLMVPLEIEPIGTGALEMSLPLALAAFDHMLGGPGGTQPNRSLTDIEVTVVRTLIDQVLGVLRYAFEPIVPIQTEAGAIEYNPQFLQIASAQDAVVVGEFDLTIGRETARLTLCLPLNRLLPRLVAKPREHGPIGVETSHPQLRERIVEVPVDLQVRFDTTNIDASVVLGLKEGDIIPLDHAVGAPLDVLVGGATVAHAVAGRAGTQLAALIVDVASHHAKEYR